MSRYDENDGMMHKTDYDRHVAHEQAEAQSLQEWHNSLDGLLRRRETLRALDRQALALPNEHAVEIAALTERIEAIRKADAEAQERKRLEALSGWTLEITVSRREEWNDWVRRMRRPTAADVQKREQYQGWKLNDLRAAVEHYKQVGLIVQ
jgi:hypothetical protein